MAVKFCHQINFGTTPSCGLNLELQINGKACDQFYVERVSFDKNYHPHKTELTRISNRALLVVSDSIDRQIRAWNSGKLFKPTYRKNITNFVFIGAFVSACFCVGAQSFFSGCRLPFQTI
ncbi:uncharacterized protein PGTG_14137 [Puccinia graminis f. sp. tritici CRL 75-36-700-3]|uniref:Uncharacterized protein n=1 Tax=Puccinia graminis f. sp. tritici (strain CRL 75-36-700-3 / race SCCL) TaxID=418459 RepID=E3KX28_PUCGT|nr:uncharacterized protein PGTG_14137 [Puccinia graminis f. sp. tritici CRL 75-36-700-3]EFP88798.1 hypothetical protein PGTG_14137 [Puccinia graminis f. sp. tritici CRL 75-36-700-3]